jgi:glutathione S-transferase
MLTLHHLNDSRSQRILWLLEELGTPHQLIHYQRNPETRLAPPELKKIHPLGKSPVITDGDIRIAESGAIVEYVIARHGGGRLALPPQHADYADYLYWLHFSNANLQPALGRSMVLRRLHLSAADPVGAAMQARLERALGWVDTRLRDVDHLAGAAFSAADIMSVFSLTTMRHFLPLDLGPCTHIRRYLARIGERPAYQRAMRRADPELVPLLG